MPINEKESASGQIKIGRRQFIELGLAAGCAALIAMKTPESTNAFSTDQDEILADILEQIRINNGVYIPSTEGEFIKNEVCFDSNNRIQRCGTGEKNTEITKEEAILIRDSLTGIPSVGTYVQLLIPFRDKSSDAIGGGGMWGHNWEYFLDPSKYPKYPQDIYLSKISAATLTLSDCNPQENITPGYK